MITKVILRNLKQFQDETFENFGTLHLLVGQNNSGKSTLLHALAIWNYCVEEFRASDRKGSKAIEISLSNFTPLPLSDFRLLWHNKTERRYPESVEIDEETKKPKRKQEFIYLTIEVTWRARNGHLQTFAVQLRWHTRNIVYASPLGGWEAFRNMDANGDVSQTTFPRIVYVPPTSNIAASEIRFDDANLRATVGEGRPGSVVRNMLLRTYQAQQSPIVGRRYQQPFDQLKTHISDWFNINVDDPIWEDGRTRYITSTYTTSGKVELDWVNAGSGLLQILIVLSFLYGFEPDVLLLDEPDAHLHVNLQRTLLQFLQRQREVQMLVATHAEEFIRRVDATSITMMTPEGPKQVSRREAAVIALSEISNLDLLNLIDRKLLVYVEGETDEELLRAWAETLASDPEFHGIQEALGQVAFVILSGGSAEVMKGRAERHFDGARLLSRDAERVIVLDRNDGKWNNLAAANPVLRVWGRRHIENYLLNPVIWKRAATENLRDLPLLVPAVGPAIDEFFRKQGLALDMDWVSSGAEVLRTIDAKRMLFEARQERDDEFDALNAQLYQQGVTLTRGDFARAMNPSEIHPDVRNVLQLIRSKVATIRASRQR